MTSLIILAILVIHVCAEISRRSCVGKMHRENGELAGIYKCIKIAEKNDLKNYVIELKAMAKNNYPIESESE
jgi:hypothetical protein